MRPGRNAPGSLEDASAFLQRGMGATRRGGESLRDLRERERALLREWAEREGCLLNEDPTLNLSRREAHGEHVVGHNPTDNRWWKTTHPGKAGVGVEFNHDDLPPFSVSGIFPRELLPSEYLERMILHNREFGDDVRLEGYLADAQPSLIVSQPHIVGSPATADQMREQLHSFGYWPLPHLEVGKKGAISFYHPVRRIALFDAHPGNFFHTGSLTIPVDGIIALITEVSQHDWLMKQASSG